MSGALIQRDAEPQQTVLGNLQAGVQLLITVNVEELVDCIAVNGEGCMAMALGDELIAMLKKNGSLLNSIGPERHLFMVAKHVHEELEAGDQ